MKNPIIEALLEMHYFSALKDFFSSIYDTEFMRILKPSSRNENWYGFDQGWVYTTLSTEELFRQLRKNIHRGLQNSPSIWCGYFLQFKPVEKMVGRTRNDYKPAGFRLPYLRSELDLGINRQTGLSQHETLRRLSNIRRSSVSYACPMLFDHNIWSPPDLSEIRFVPVRLDSPSWVNGRHFIAFQDTTGNDFVWKSEEIEGKAISFKEWFIGIDKMDGKGIIDLIEDSVKEIKKATQKENSHLVKNDKDEITSLLPSSLTIIEMKSQD